MRCLIPLLAAVLALALLVGCGAGGSPAGGDDGSQPAQGEDASQGDGSSSGEHGGEEPPESDTSLSAGEPNTALSRVEGLESVPVDCLMAIKNYHGEMAWGEANAIANLDRVAVESGDYLLIVPHYAHSRVVVERMDYQTADFDSEAPAYLLEDSPDDYALILNTMLPEGMPDYRVTVSHGGMSASYTCSYDGRGGTVYPEVRDGCLLTEAAPAPGSGDTPAPAQYKASQGVFTADVDYGHAGFGYYVHYTALVPEDWEEQPFEVGAEVFRYRGEGLWIHLWGFLDLPANYHHVTHFLDVQGESYTLVTPGDRVYYRATNPHGNLFYAFELPDADPDPDSTLCVMVQLYDREGGGAPSLRVQQYDAAIAQFLDSIQTQLEESDFAQPPSLG